MSCLKSDWTGAPPNPMTTERWIKVQHSFRDNSVSMRVTQRKEWEKKNKKKNEELQLSAAIKTQQRGVSVTLKQPHTHTHTHRVTQSHRHWTEVQLRGALLKHLTEQHNMMICCWWVHSYLLAPPHTPSLIHKHTHTHTRKYTSTRGHTVVVLQ